MTKNLIYITKRKAITKMINTKTNKLFKHECK